MATSQTGHPQDDESAEPGHLVPLFPAGADEIREGFVRVINHSRRAGEVQIEAFDDEGVRFGPTTLAMDTVETVHFNSTDLEEGNPAKGLSVGVGTGSGDWRLTLSSTLDVEVLSYIRTPADGFLTSMHDLVPREEDDHYRVAIFNPGSNRDQESRLRLINPGDQDAAVTITGIDGNGVPGDGEVRLTLPAGASRTIDAHELESGGSGLAGALGDGAGKWQLDLESDRSIHAMSLLLSPTGHLTNLSTAPSNVDEGAHAVSIFPAASDPSGRQGFVRVVNHSDESGGVTISAFDDTDGDFGTSQLALDANETVHFNSDDLEMGNASKGLTGGTGAGEGDWRLVLESDLDIEVLAYIRTTDDGFLTAMHDTVPREGERHRVAIFNPGANVNQVSRLRLVNSGDEAAEIEITGIDGAGRKSVGSATVSVSAGSSPTLSAQELEAGGEGFDGELGDGAGKWQLLVESDQPITVMSLLDSPTGHLTNLSTAPALDYAPADGTVFDDRAVGMRIATDNEDHHTEFPTPGRFRETIGAVVYEGDYSYTRTAPSEGTLVYDYEDGDRCTAELFFRSRTAGTSTYTCDDGETGGQDWWVVEIPGAGGGGTNRTVYEVDDTITTMPTGSWIPDRTRNGSFSESGGRVTISLQNGGFVEEGDYRYTCESTGGCEIEDGVVKSGRVAETTISDTAETPDLAVESPSASDIAPVPGGALTLGATVRNRGSGGAPETTLRFYRSSNPVVSTGDVEVGSVAVGELAASDSVEHSVDVAAPADVGTYYFGACVASVEDESDTSNNCSAGLAVTVSNVPVATCEVDLRRTSTAGGTETVSFALPNASPAPAGTSNVPTRLEASMDDANDFDVYEIGLRAAGRLTGLSLGSLDTQAVFVNEDCAELDSIAIVEDVGRLPGVASGNLNFAVTGDVGAGTYYLVVFEWAGRTGDYSLELLFDDPLVNDAPVIADIPGQELAPDDSVTVLVQVNDDRGDTHTVTAQSGDVEVATVAVRTRPDGGESLVIDGVAEGTTTISVDASDREGEPAATVSFDVVVTTPTLAAPTVETGSGAGELDVTIRVTLGARETRAFDYQVRRKAPQSPWLWICVRWINNGRSTITADAKRTFADLAAGVRFEVRHRDRGGASCADGSPGRWSAVGEGTSRAQARTMALASANGNPAGIAHLDGTLYVLDDLDDKIYAYTTSGERDADADFDLADVNARPEGITVANGKLYVADDVDVKIYAYDVTGPRDEDSEFDLHSSNSTPWGMTFANGKFHVVDATDDKVYVYSASGERDEDSEFDLDPDNGLASGIAYAGNRFYLAEWLDETVYVYDSAGEREPDLDFDLDDGNTRPEGIVHAQASFFVVDDGADRIFIYAEHGGASDSPLIFLDAPAAQRAIQENVPGGINVGAPVEASGGDALVYTIGGDDGASFDIVADTGQIRTLDDVLYDFEARNRYGVEVEVADDAGNRETIDVTIYLVDLVPSCALADDLDVRANDGDGRLSVRWRPLPNIPDVAPVLGYETEIRSGGGSWTDRRTFFGRRIGGATYDDLDNGVEYDIRVRPINSEAECDWSDPVSGTPSADLAPRDDREHDDQFGPHPVGSDTRNYRLLWPERCRHTLDGVNLDADCTYERTGPDAGRITLEFDDPSKGSCDVALAYSSLTAGSFVDECFDAGVNTDVSFDRSFRMPELAGEDVEAAAPRAPRTAEEFDVFAWGREDLIPGLGFGCLPLVGTCEFASGEAYTIGREPETGLPVYKIGEYTYENTGPASGKLTVRGSLLGTYTITLEFEPSGNVRTMIEADDTAVWPGMPHLDLTLGAQPVLLPIPPSWRAAIAVERDFAPQDPDADLAIVPETSSCNGIGWTHPVLCTLFGGRDAVLELLTISTGAGVFTRALNARYDFVRTGRNRVQVTVGWHREYDIPESDRSDVQNNLLGSTWVFDLMFTSEGVAKYVLTVSKDGHLPTVLEGFVDFTGDGIDPSEFPEELQLPDEAPQASGEDVSGVEVAAATTVGGIGGDDVQTMLVSASGAEFEAGDWLEPKDGGNQRMMIVGTGQAASALGADAPSDALRPSVLSVTKTRLDVWPSHVTAGVFKSHGFARASRSAPGTASSDLVRLTVVCMQIASDIPTRGARYFSKAKSAGGDVQLCQQACVLNQANFIQRCVWNCE